MKMVSVVQMAKEVMIVFIRMELSFPQITESCRTTQ